MKANPLLALSAAVVLLAGCAATPESGTQTTAAGADADQTSGPDAPASASMSPTQPVDTGQTFMDMDTNRDGMLTRDEVAKNEMLTQHFDQADTDRNGSLSQAEVNAHRASMASKP